MTTLKLDLTNCYHVKAKEVQQIIQIVHNLRDGFDKTDHLEECTIVAETTLLAEEHPHESVNTTSIRQHLYKNRQFAELLV